MSNKFPSDIFHPQFIDLFPSNDDHRRMELKLLLDELSHVPDSFCGAAWFPKTFSFSHLSAQVETIIGYPLARYFDLGVFFLHSLVPTELVPEMNSQVSALINSVSDPAFSIFNDEIYFVKGTVRRPDQELVTCNAHVIFLDQATVEGNYFFVGCWQRVDRQSTSAIEVRSKEIKDLLKEIKAVYSQLYPERFVNSRVTGKEREVLHLISLGLTTKEIAQQLNISFHTVESHRKSLLEKLNCKNVAHLVSKTVNLF